MRATARQGNNLGVFQKAVLILLWYKTNYLCSWSAQLWESYYSSYWKFCEKCEVHFLVRQKRNLPSGPQRNFRCDKRTCRYNLQAYQNVILLSQNIFLYLKQRNPLKNLLSLYLRMTYFHLSSGWIPHGNERKYLPDFQKDKRDDLHSFF